MQMGQWAFFIFIISIFCEFTFAAELTLQQGQIAQVSQSEQGLPYLDTMIVIAVDVSGSVNSDEYKIQKDGIIKAFSDPSVQNLLLQCTTSGIGVTYLEWSGSGYSQAFGSFVNNPFVQVIPWTRLMTPEDMNHFANQLLASPRSSDGETDIARSLEFARSLFSSAPFQSQNRIVSLSTDGRQGRTIAGISAEDFVKMERDKLASLGVTINGIAIESTVEVDPRLGGGSFPSDKEDSLKDYLNQNLRTGQGSFVESVPDFESYSEAFKKQLYVMMNACIS